MYRILAINPGSTTTKVAVYDDEKEVFRESLEHDASDLSCFSRTADQYAVRREAVLGVLAGHSIDVGTLSALVGRGGFLPPLKSGAYIINKVMLRRLAEAPVVEHAANLAAPIAYSIADALSIPAYIYDSVAVDELIPLARISGHAEIERRSLCHVLNMRATAIRCSRDLGRPYTDCNFIIAHLGGGITLSVHEKGRIVDIVSDDEGPFAPERAGVLPVKDVIRFCFAEDEASVRRKFRGRGGLVSYLGTASALDVEKRVLENDEQAALVFNAMAYQVAKGIGSLAAVVCGRVDAIILTGGIARSELFTDWIRDRISFIAPVRLYPGENELESLALGALRVLRGEESARVYEDAQFSGESPK